MLLPVTTNLVDVVDVRRVIAPTAAGTTDVNGTGIDMSNANGVMFVVGFGTITSGAVTSVIGEESDDNSNWSAITGASVTVADDDDNLIAVLDVRNFAKKYVRCTVDRATQNAVVDLGVAVVYGNTNTPVTQGATVLGTDKV